MFQIPSQEQCARCGPKTPFHFIHSVVQRNAFELEGMCSSLSTRTSVSLTFQQSTLLTVRRDDLREANAQGIHSESRERESCGSILYLVLLRRGHLVILSPQHERTC